MTPPISEAAVEAAARSLFSQSHLGWADWSSVPSEFRDENMRNARAALTAARPHMVASALREFRAGLGRRFWLQDPYGHFGQEAVSAFHRQIEGLLDSEIARAATIAERTQR